MYASKLISDSLGPGIETRQRPDLPRDFVNIRENKLLEGEFGEDDLIQIYAEVTVRQAKRPLGLIRNPAGRKLRLTTGIISALQSIRLARYTTFTKSGRVRASSRKFSERPRNLPCL
jgi:hypothetical protein